MRNCRIEQRRERHRAAGGDSAVTEEFGGSVRQIIAVDTVRAYHFGVNYLVEVDIVLPADMPLREAHDIGESLQVRPRAHVQSAQPLAATARAVLC